MVLGVASVKQRRTKGRERTLTRRFSPLSFEATKTRNASFALPPVRLSLASFAQALCIPGTVLGLFLRLALGFAQEDTSPKLEQFLIPHPSSTAVIRLDLDMF